MANSLWLPYSTYQQKKLCSSQKRGFIPNIWCKEIPPVSLWEKVHFTQRPSTTDHHSQPTERYTTTGSSLFAEMATTATLHVTNLHVNTAMLNASQGYHYWQTVFHHPRTESLYSMWDKSRPFQSLSRISRVPKDEILS